jgi:hypothetical protein
LKYHTACGTSVMTQTLINCADPMTDLMVFFQTLSSWSTSSVEEVNSVGPGIRFFQLYVCIICMNLQESLLMLCSSHWSYHESSVSIRSTRTGI